MSKVKRYGESILSGMIEEKSSGWLVEYKDYANLLAEHDAMKEQVTNLAVENATLQSTIKELELTVSKWEDCKHNGATWYDYSGREKCGCCGADV